MTEKLKYIFVYIFILSVFSLTLQSTIINACKGSKVFKTQNQQSPVNEEEEEKTHGNEKLTDKEVLYLNDYLLSKFLPNLKCLAHNGSSIYLPSVTKKIQIPPPKC